MTVGRQGHNMIQNIPKKMAVVHVTETVFTTLMFRMILYIVLLLSKQKRIQCQAILNTV